MREPGGSLGCWKGMGGRVWHGLSWWLANGDGAGLTGLAGARSCSRPVRSVPHQFALGVPRFAGSRKAPPGVDPPSSVLAAVFRFGRWRWTKVRWTDDANRAIRFEPLAGPLR